MKILLFLLPLLMLACGGNRPSASSVDPGLPANATTPVPITDIDWQLAEFADGPITDLPKEVPTLTLSEGTATGNAGCNRYRGPYTMEGSGEITFGALMSTKMACPALDLENRFTTALAATTDYTLTDNILTLSNNGDVLMRFSR